MFFVQMPNKNSVDIKNNRFIALNSSCETILHMDGFNLVVANDDKRDEVAKLLNASVTLETPIAPDASSSTPAPAEAKHSNADIMSALDGLQGVGEAINFIIEDAKKNNSAWKSPAVTKAQRSLSECFDIIVYSTNNAINTLERMLRENCQPK